MQKFLLPLTLLGLSLLPGAAAQTSVLSIPALPAGATLPPANSAPALPAPAPRPLVSPMPVPTTTPVPVPMPIPVPMPGAPASRPSAPIPSASTLPSRGQPLSGQYSAQLSGPKLVQAGTPTVWSFVLTNTGRAPLQLEHGACDVRFEVLNAAGQVVRPDPKNTVCTLQIVYFDAKPGQSAEVQKIRWDGRDASGQPVTPGTYTVRAVLSAGGRLTPAANLNVAVR